jgi:hypothetical protein
MEPDVCLRSHAREKRTAFGSALCGPCVKQVERNLRALPGLHQECLHHMTPSAGRISNPTKVSGSRERDHLNVSVLDTRYNITAVLESWAQIVLDELPVPAPDRSITELVGFLLRHLDWLTAQSPAGDFVDEIDGLLADLLRVVDPEHGGHRAPAVACVVDDCTGNISTSPPPAESTGKGTITCSSGHSWEVREWLVLRQLMQRKRKEVA